MARMEEMALLNAAVQWLQHAHRGVNVLVQFLSLRLFNQQPVGYSGREGYSASQGRYFS